MYVCMYVCMYICILYIYKGTHYIVRVNPHARLRRRYARHN